MKPTQKPSAVRVLAAAGLASAALSLTACQKADASASPPARAAAPAGPPAVTVVSARTVQATPSEQVTGTLYPAQGLMVGFEVGGRLSAVQVTKGQAVKKGEVLARLDPEISDAQVAQAEAAVAAAEAAHTLAADVAARNEKLQEQGGVSEVAHRTATANAAQARAQWLAAQAQLAQARASRRRHDLRAPFDGTIIDAPEQTGATVAPGTPLFKLERLDTLLLKTTVSEALRSQLKPGARVRVESVGARVSSEEAVVRTILPSADPATRRVPVELAVPNADGRFVAHTLARAALSLGEARDAQVLPGSALSALNGDHVWVVTSGQVHRVDVQVLERREQGEVVVLAASPLGSVVDHPTPALSQGARVSVK
ncbi:efflux RND transporter periplasmic adaptor subunit [Corallococcus macrosporus]|uniref:RND transporter n=1 Tax=Corallococcus macrosporus DSM 14697 TaxID=1189310 RepID=A0A250JPQ1_9BACT|nr:efflux RND transporter periplasmic adaptor subunit [Corallococcus macrosporus]ATB45096.1 RND transporter [Corallococcus macrosporus DSM 14697]